MPVGEIAGLAAGLTFAFTSIGDKFLSARAKPLTISALSALGGGVFALALASILGQTGELLEAPAGYVLLGMLGGILNIGVGHPLYLWYLKSVDISKASPLVHGFTSLFSVLSGVFLLAESPAPLAFTGMGAIVFGTYLLSFAQRRTVVKTQAPWLGVKGVVFLAFISCVWVAGFTLQGIALREVSPLTVNMTRLLGVGLYLMVLIRLGVNDALTPERRRAFRWPHRHRMPAAVLRGEAAEAIGIPAQVSGSDGVALSAGASPIPQGPVVELRRGWFGRHGGSWAPMRGTASLIRWRSRVFRTRGETLEGASVAVGSPRNPALAENPASPSSSILGQKAAVGPPSTGPALVEGTRRPATPRKTLALAVANGAFNMGVGSLFYLIAIQKTGIAIATILGSTQLFFVAVLSSMILREGINKNTVLGICVVFAGVILIVV